MTVASGHAPGPGQAFVAPSATLSQDVGMLKQRLAEAVVAVREAETSRPRRSGRPRRTSADDEGLPSRLRAAQSAVGALELLADANAALNDCDTALRRGALERAVVAVNKSEGAIAALSSLVDSESWQERPATETAKAGQALEALTQAADTKRVRVAHAAASSWMSCFYVARGAEGRAAMDTARASDIDSSAMASLGADPADSDASWLDALKSGVAAAVHVQSPIRDGRSTPPSATLALLLRLSPHAFRSALASSASSLASEAIAPALTGRCGLVPVLLPLARRQRGERLIAVVNPPSLVASIVAGAVDAPEGVAGHQNSDAVLAASAAVSRVSRTVTALFVAMGLPDSPPTTHTAVSQAGAAVEAARDIVANTSAAAAAEESTRAASVSAALDVAEAACMRQLATCLLLARVWWGDSLDEAEPEASDGDIWAGTPGVAAGRGRTITAAAASAASGGAELGEEAWGPAPDLPVPHRWTGLAPAAASLELAAGDAMDALDAGDAASSGCGLALALCRLLADSAPERVDEADTLADAAQRSGRLEAWVLAQLAAGAAAAAAVARIGKSRAAIKRDAATEESKRAGNSDDDGDDVGEDELDEGEAADAWTPPALLAALCSDLPHHAAVARRRSVLARARDICIGSGFAAAVTVSEDTHDLAPGTVSAAVGLETAASPGRAALQAAKNDSEASRIAAADAAAVAVTSDGDWVDDGWGSAWEEESPHDTPAPAPAAVDDAAIAAADAAPGHEASEAAAAAASVASMPSTAAAAAMALLAPAGRSAALYAPLSLSSRVQHARMASALRSRSARVLPTPFFRLPRCQVSRAAVDLVALARETMHEAARLANPSPSHATAALPEAAVERAASILYHAARDALSLYRAVVPAAFGSELAGNARVAALVHNDCLFLAHHATTLGHTFRRSLPGSLARSASFADLVAPLRDMAERALLHQVRAQRTAIGAILRLPGGSDVPPAVREVLAEPVAPGLPRSSLLVPIDACASATTSQLDCVLEQPVRTVLDRLDSLAGAWAVLLPTRVYRAAIAHLLDTALATLTSSVLAATILPRGVAAACAHALGLLVQAAPLIVAGDEADAAATANAGSGSGASLRLSPAAIQGMLPHLARAARLQDLLDAIAAGGLAALDAKLRAAPRGELCREASDTTGPLSRVEAACIVRAAGASPAAASADSGHDDSVRAALLADLH